MTRLARRLLTAPVRRPAALRPVERLEDRLTPAALDPLDCGCAVPGSVTTSSTAATTSAGGDGQPADHDHDSATTAAVVANCSYVVGSGAGTSAAVTAYRAAGDPVTLAPFEAAFTGGVRVALGDLTGDGVADLVAAAGPGGGPRVAVLDGATGRPVPGPLASFFAFEPAFAGGVQVAVGDVLGDGYPSLVAAADAGGGPRVSVFDGRTGALRASFFAFEPGFAGGVRLAAADLLGLGYDQLVVAAGPGGGPRVRVLDASSGEPAAGLLGDFLAADPGWAGGLSVAAGAVLADGRAGLAVGVGPEVRVYDPATGAVAATDRPFEAGYAGGLSLAAGGLGGGWGLVAAPQAGGGPVVRGLAGAGAGDAALAGDPDDRGGVSVAAFGGGGGPGTNVLSCNYAPADGAGSDQARSLPASKCGYPSMVPDAGCVSNSLPWAPPIRGLPGDLGQAPPLLGPDWVRWADGVVKYDEGDLLGTGFSVPWGHGRSWSNWGFTVGNFNGNRWIDTGLPGLLEVGGGTQLILPTDGANNRTFDLQSGGGYLERYGLRDALAHDATAGQYELTDFAGDRVRMWDFDPSLPALKRGRFQSYTDPAGNVVEVTAETTDGKVQEVQRSYASGSNTATDSVLYTYNTDGLIATATLRRRDSASGSWYTVRSVAYTYYDGVEAHGNAKDLKLSEVKDAAGTVLDTRYYRYYVPSEANGYAGGLKLAVGASAYARMVGDGLTPGTATDAQVAGYADRAFEYDSTRRVTKSVVAGAGCSACSAGFGTTTYSYTAGTNGAGVNSWAMKTAVGLPDGTADTVYTNAYGQVMLSAHTEASQTWSTYYHYTSDHRVDLVAMPSAVSGFDDTSADLVGYSFGNAAYLRDAAGLVTTYSRYSGTSSAADGMLEQTDLRQGETGTAVPQQLLTYTTNTANGQALPFLASSTVYRNDNGTGGQTTSFAYTWYSGTNQVKAVTTTLPTVTTAQNGPNAATSAAAVYDTLGRPAWGKDAGGFLTYTAYDPATGAVVKSIQDVDTAQTSTFAGLPSGWSTPTGGGLHLTTTAEVDALGRATKTTAPNGRVDYTVYLDTAYEVRTYPAWDATASAPTGPTQVWRDDRARGYTESLTLSATPAVSGGRPTGTESIGSLQSDTRRGRNTAGQTVTTDVYFALSALTYTTAASFGTSGTNFDRTQQGYDKRGRANKTVSAAGTIARTEYDGLGRVTSQWVGTDDVPTTGFWSVTNTAGTDMTKVRSFEYDGGGVGDGNRTTTTEHPGLGAADRVTRTWFDWRNRPVAVKQGVETSEATDVNRPLTYTEYDNLGQTLFAERYDADGVTPTVTAGVPDRPSSSLLRAKSGASYDELGRAFRQDQYSVDPASGSVGTDTLHTDTWFDARGLVAKTAAPGGLVAKTAYDGAGRPTLGYQTDGGGDTSYADALAVTGDAVLTQTETTYDAWGNVLATATRERFHDATGTGPLGSPSSGVAARVSYTGYYYDLADRPTDSVSVGTNGGSAWTRPGTVPTRSDTALVNSTVYDAAGRTWNQTDPRGIETRTAYDAAGRVATTVENYADGTVSDGDDKTTEYAYGPAGLVSLTAKLTGGGGQTTEWVYGVTAAGGSGLTSNDVVGKTYWPDPATGAASSSQQDTVKVNAVGQPVELADRNGTTHALGYDVVGRQVADAVTLLGTNVDGAVRRVTTAYDGQGNASLVTSHNAASGGSVVNQVKREYTGLGQLAAEWQAHGGTVGSGTPKVEYGYSGMPSGANHSRPTTLTYPDGRVVGYTYASGLDASISRLSALTDGSTTLEGYQYLGLGTVVRRTRPEIGVDLSYVKLSGESVGDAGDQYTGLDRFGRVADQRWLVASTGATVDRYGYTHDRAGNRLTRSNGNNNAFDETYTYDGLGQLASFARGSTRTQSWDYDAVGNWDSVTTNGTSQTRTANRQNEVTSVSGATAPTFDAAGNMTGDEQGRTLVWDAWNRLVAYKNGGTTLAAYAYDGLGRRVVGTEGGVTTDLYYSAGWQVLEERVGGAATTQYVWSTVYVDALVERDRDADGNAGTGTGGREERLYALQDANWNTTALVTMSGAVSERFAYDPFGAMIVYDSSYTVRSGGSSYGWAFGFQGLNLSAGTGFYHARNRDYSPVLGRFVSEDPIEYNAGDQNLYRFACNEPVTQTDPSGLFVGEPWYWWLWPQKSAPTPPVSRTIPRPPVKRPPGTTYTPPPGKPPYGAQPREVPPWIGMFPYLEPGSYTILGPKDPKYNCYAHASGHTDRNLLERDTVRVSDVLAHFEDLGFSVSKSCDPEPGKVKIAVFANDKGEPTHVASQADGAWWKSKLGGSNLILHKLQDLEGPYYGHVLVCLEKKK